MVNTLSLSLSVSLIFCSGRRLLCLVGWPGREKSDELIQNIGGGVFQQSRVTFGAAGAYYVMIRYTSVLGRRSDNSTYGDGGRCE